jgi:hypothetical protein
MASGDLAATINAQIEQIKWQMRAYRRVVKRNLDDALVVESAEEELRSLETRLSVLKGNLKKLENA